jgi:hypothetical protein
MQVLNLNGTDVKSFEAIEDLVICCQLNTLSLKHTLLGKIPNYREVIGVLLPNLVTLDDAPVDLDRRLLTTRAVVEEARRLLQELVFETDEERRFEDILLEQPSFQAEPFNLG